MSGIRQRPTKGGGGGTAGGSAGGGTGGMAPLTKRKQSWDTTSSGNSGPLDEYIVNDISSGNGKPNHAAMTEIPMAAGIPVAGAAGSAATSYQSASSSWNQRHQRHEYVTEDAPHMQHPQQAYVHNLYHQSQQPLHGGIAVGAAVASAAERTLSGNSSGSIPSQPSLHQDYHHHHQQQQLPPTLLSSKHKMNHHHAPHKAVELVHVAVPATPEKPMRRRKTSTASSSGAGGAGKASTTMESYHNTYHSYHHHGYTKSQYVPIENGSSISGFGQFPIMRKAHAVPDSKYHAYLHGRYHPRRHGSSNGAVTTTAEKPMLNSMCCANFCFGISIVAIVFLVFIGILFDSQPLYIKGVLPQHIQYIDANNLQRTKVFYETKPAQRMDITKNAYKAALMYAFTAMMCMAYTQNWLFYIKSHWNQYHDIPDNESTIPRFHNDDDDDHDDGDSNNNGNNTGGNRIHNNNSNNNIALRNRSAMQQAYAYNMRISSKIWNFGIFCMNRIYQSWSQSSSSETRRRRKRAPGAKDV
mmetsp:Transcript_23493/g.66475  ORF Transcript_23493/g.66475 Transcript_23493/m.66475 type:complete len:525 (-) Transcript_23493:138-1712(-)|eukprot:CAMPEP_0119563106 /NCGR_PEP_ID=MMETSP1352-20130426/22475_1 /TAXON_ID=265584 /ORGANISM="Stauroneis constricta, Strain CCMP1120" /LENGTH=524 /DNA_ID=CAMNT_0007611647 /DNA_START=166 /DNA_END=1740 /DNA_ORIENTATION=+